MKKGRARSVLTGLFAGILILGLLLGGSYLWREYQQKQKQEDLKEKVVDQEALEEPKESNPIDFASLWNLNPDVYAWIDVPGTEISYPVLQSAEDNSYYLEHTIEGERNAAGGYLLRELQQQGLLRLQYDSLRSQYAKRHHVCRAPAILRTRSLCSRTGRLSFTCRTGG